MINKYMAEYSEDFKYEFSESLTYEICGISVKVDVWEYNSDAEYREKAHISLEKGDLKYECECIDRHEWDNMFYPLNMNGKTYLCFRKTLYGFTLLDTETLVEEYDFFPESVLGGEESFIIVDAKILGDIIIFYGCYWACPYACIAYDNRAGVFVNLSDEYGIADDEVVIKDDVLVLRATGCNDDKKETTFSIDEIRLLLKNKGCAKSNL